MAKTIYEHTTVVSGKERLENPNVVSEITAEMLFELFEDYPEFRKMRTKVEMKEDYKNLESDASITITVRDPRNLSRFEWMVYATILFLAVMFNIFVL